MTTHHLDPAVYGDYRQRVEFSIEGAHVRWIGIPATEQERIVPIIRRQLALLAGRYNTAVDEGPDHIYLELKFRDPASAAGVLVLKGDVFALLVATSWGGP